MAFDELRSSVLKVCSCCNGENHEQNELPENEANRNLLELSHGLTLTGEQ